MNLCYTQTLVYKIMYIVCNKDNFIYLHFKFEAEQLTSKC